MLKPFHWFLVIVIASVFNIGLLLLPQLSSVHTGGRSENESCIDWCNSSYVFTIGLPFRIKIGDLPAQDSNNGMELYANGVPSDFYNHFSSFELVKFSLSSISFWLNELFWIILVYACFYYGVKSRPK